MKKTLSMIIAIAMIAAMLIPMSILASAEEVVEVSSWAQFVELANAAYGEGSYKLTADTTADASVEGFFGSFDGGDHVITTSTTLFKDISGPATIKNFTVNPAKDADGNDVVLTVNPVIEAAVGSFIESPIWISGITNNVSVGLLPTYVIDGDSLQEPTAGILGRADSENHIYIYDVVNNGDMVSDDQTGGIVGNCGHTSGKTYLTIVNAINNGDVFAFNSYAGGIVGNVNAQLIADFRYCINTGDVASENDAGGIIGQVNGSAEGTLSYCANSGLIDQNPTIVLADGTERKLTGGDKTGTKYGAAGICPRFSNSNVNIAMDNCVVMGVMDNDATADGSAYSSADPFNGYANGNTITLTNCSYLVSMTAIGEQASILKEGASGFTALDQVACQAAFDSIVAAAANQPAPEISTESAEESEPTDDPAVSDPTDDPAVSDPTDDPATDAPATDAPASDATKADTKAPAATKAPEAEGGCGSSISLAIVAVVAAGAVAIARKKED
jgi:hypothetical protein